MTRATARPYVADPIRPPWPVALVVVVVCGPLVLALYAAAAAVTHARRVLARRPSPRAVALAIRIATARRITRRNHR